DRGHALARRRAARRGQPQLGRADALGGGQLAARSRALCRSGQLIMKRVGVLAVQGAFERHGHVVHSLGHEPVYVRSPADLNGLDRLILPGGESSVQLQMLARLALEAPLTALVQSGKPVLATCAGVILAARSVQHPEQRSYGWIDLSVARNAYGRQLDS